MLAGRIMVCPMDDPTFCIPLVFPIKRNPISFAQAIHPGCEINVMRKQQSLTIGKPDDKPLMPAAIDVVAQYSRYRTPAFNLDIALALLECDCNWLVAGGSNLALIAEQACRTGRCLMRLRKLEVGYNQNGDEQKLLHFSLFNFREISSWQRSACSHTHLIHE